jgi:hypothetical protein
MLAYVIPHESGEEFVGQEHLAFTATFTQYANGPLLEVYIADLD